MFEIISPQNIQFLQQIILQGVKEMMKKYIATLIMMVVPAVTLPLAMPTTAEAQKQYVQRYVDRNGRVRYRRVAKPSFYRSSPQPHESRHRNWRRRVNRRVGWRKKKAR
jgi:hypothetical protein